MRALHEPQVTFVISFVERAHGAEPRQRVRTTACGFGYAYARKCTLSGFFTALTPARKKDEL